MRFRMSRKEILFIIIFIISSFQNMYSSPIKSDDGWMEFYNEKILIIGEGLRIREEPNIEAKILGRLSYGDIVTGEWNEKYKRVKAVFEFINNEDLLRMKDINYKKNLKNFWVYIRTDEGLKGWVYGDFIACPFIKYDDRVVYVEYRRRDFIYMYGTSSYKDALNNGSEKNFIYNYMTPILVIKYPDKKIDLELNYFIDESNFDLKLLYPFKIKEIKMWDGVNTLIIKTDTESLAFEQGGGLGPRYNYLFKYDRDRIDRIFEYEDGNVLEFVKDDGKVKKIRIYTQYKVTRINKNDFDKILEKLTIENQEKFKKYYYLVEPKINDKNIKENILSFREYFSLNELNEDDKKIFNKYIYCDDNFGCKFYNIKTKKDVEIVNDLYDRNKNSLYFSYQLKPNLSFEQLKDAREILVGSGYIKNYEDEIKTYVWNEKEFIEEKK